jgi:hypothetical protein
VVGGATAAGGAGGGGGDTGTQPSTDCGSQTHNTSHQLVDIVLVLDRSGSMLFNISENCFCNDADKKAVGTTDAVCKDPAKCSTRWAAVSTGIESAVSATPFLQWGLKFFSSPNQVDCAVTKEMEVPIPNGTASTIRDKINNTPPKGYTPTAAGISAAAAYLKGLTDGNPKVILLATDGVPNCAENERDLNTSDIPGTLKAIDDAFKQDIKTYVLGIGPSTGNLDDFAKAGHTDKHFPATSPEALKDALNAIGTAAISCSFSLTDKPTDATNAAVYVNKELVQKDDPDGWSYGPDGTTIELTGATCEKVKSERETAVQVLYGCKVPPRRID